MPLSDWTTADLVGGLAATLAALAALAGIGAFYLARVDAAREAAEFLRFKEESRLEVAAANARAADAHARAVESERGLAEARKQTAELELKLEEVRSRQAPRTLRCRPEMLSKVLQTRAGVQASVAYVTDDEEAYMFALSLTEAIDLSGWSVGEPFPINADLQIRPELTDAERRALSRLPLMMRLGGQPLSGLLVFGSAPEHKTGEPPTDAATILTSALRTCGHDVSNTTDPGLDSDRVWLFVGRKP